jgi:hypothetical protein
VQAGSRHGDIARLLPGAPPAPWAPTWATVTPLPSPLHRVVMTSLCATCCTRWRCLWIDAEPVIGSAGRGKALMALEYHTPIIVVRDPENPEARAHLRTIGVLPGSREYEIRAVNDQIALGRGPTYIFFGFRSLKEIMGIASECVQIPPELDARGIAPPPRYQRTGERRLAFKVHSSKDEPLDPRL